MRSTTCLLGIASCFALTSLALGQPGATQNRGVSTTGDADRGNALYHTTYRCSDCHVRSPMRGDTLSVGATVGGLTNALHTVPEMRNRYQATLAQNSPDIDDIAAYIAVATGIGP